MTIEAGVVVSNSNAPLYWHTPPGATVVQLPDSTGLWDAIWHHREEVQGFAHTHPGSGVPAPSHTDLTTFAAIEAALGRRLVWWILSRDKVVRLRWSEKACAYVDDGHVLPDPWMGVLRDLSLTPHERAEVSRRHLLNEIRGKLLTLAPFERVEILAMTHICVDCGEDLRVTPERSNICDCLRDE